MLNRAVIFKNTHLTDWIALLSIVLMLFGFLFARGLLSVGMILLFLNALHPAYIKSNWLRLKSNYFGLLCAGFFCVYFLSGLWSSNTSEWLKDAQIKLPFLVFPFSMASLRLQDDRMKLKTLVIILAVLPMGMLYSIYFAIQNPGSFFENRYVASPVARDYLRYTISLVLAMNLIVFVLLKHGGLLTKRQKTLLALWSLIAVIYIHAQGSKLGLLSLYLTVVVYILYFLFKKRKYIKQVLLGLAILLVCLVGATQLPTIKKQIERTRNERIAWSQGDTEGYKTANSFIPRWISYQVGYSLIKKNPLLGVGSGDLVDEMKREYKEIYPYMRMLIPHNQAIYSMVAVGIPFSAFFWLMLGYPLMRKPEIFEAVTVLIMLCGTMIEAMLEVQYGVFVYLFFTLLWFSMKPLSQNRMVGMDKES